MVSRRSFLSQLAVLGLAGAGAWWLRDHVLWAPPKAVFAQGTSSGWIPFADAGAGMAVVEARVNGAAILALLDSGAQSSVLDRGLADRLGLGAGQLGPMILAFGVSGGPQVGRGARIDVTVPGLALQGLHAAVFDLAPAAEASRRGFGLILGQDVLSQLIADIDFPAAQLAFRRHVGFTPPDGALAVPVRAHGRQLLAPVTVESAALELLIDTGASGAIALSEETARSAGLLDGRRVDQAPSIGLSGLAEDRVVRAGSVTFAGETRRNVPVHIFTPSRGAPLPKGLVGVETYARHRLIVDVAGAGVYLAPSLVDGARRRRPRLVLLQRR